MGATQGGYAVFLGNGEKVFVMLVDRDVGAMIARQDGGQSLLLRMRGDFRPGLPPGPPGLPGLPPGGPGSRPDGQDYRSGYRDGYQRGCDRGYQDAASGLEYDHEFGRHGDDGSGTKMTRRTCQR